MAQPHFRGNWNPNVPDPTTTGVTPSQNPNWANQPQATPHNPALAGALGAALRNEMINTIGSIPGAPPAANPPPVQQQPMPNSGGYQQGYNPVPSPNLPPTGGYNQGSYPTPPPSQPTPMAYNQGPGYNQGYNQGYPHDFRFCDDLSQAWST
eukprot:TRINITY_DN1917_c0_g1_i2.p1 TRINITY_DN1917_c0_g1~~TRINITY_DN1917_c0_g1_i2.p1  ORF type:complete len:152 (-),score=52.26 TRINITY_DN1917_c0_g1_i2:16-471(-)